MMEEGGLFFNWLDCIKKGYVQQVECVNGYVHDNNNAAIFYLTSAY